MTCRACRLGVSANKRKARFGVVEGANAVPALLAVAALALIAEPAFMRIFDFMTIDATAGRFAEFNALCMTAFAGHGFVAADELEIREKVIERFLI